MFQGPDVKIKGEMLEDFNKNIPKVGQGRTHAGFVGFKHGCHTVKTRRQYERPPSRHVTRPDQPERRKFKFNIAFVHYESWF